jgi:hypothetical protein
MARQGTYPGLNNGPSALEGFTMTDQKKSASPNSLTETGKDAKVELTEAQLKEVAGGAFDSFLKLEDHKLQSSSPTSSPAQAASINFTLKI